MILKKKFYVLLCCMFTNVILYAQVGINTDTPHISAALEIISPDNNQGILLPRMTTLQKNNISNPAEGLLIYDTDLKCISQNAGTEDDPAWVCLSQKDAQNSFFYMPTIAIDASKPLHGQTVDLYNEYKLQFTAPIKNPSAPTNIPYFTSRSDLNYYITSYDTNVLDIKSISDDGIMTYDVLAESDYDSFMTIVFVLK